MLMFSPIQRPTSVPKPTKTQFEAGAAGGPVEMVQHPAGYNGEEIARTRFNVQVI